MGECVKHSIENDGFFAIPISLPHAIKTIDSRLEQLTLAAAAACLSPSISVYWTMNQSVSRIHLRCTMHVTRSIDRI